jgi:hypothetical protein
MVDGCMRLISTKENIMGSKAEVGNAVATLAIHCILLIPYGLAAISILMWVCAGLSLKDRDKASAREYAGIAFPFTVITLIVVAIFWFLALPDNPLPR